MRKREGDIGGEGPGIRGPRIRRRSGVSAHAAGWPGGVLLVLICLGVYLPGLWSLPPVDRDESRFAQASRQMAEAQDWSGWLIPMVQDRPRLNKPPLIYWLQAASARAIDAGKRRSVNPWMHASLVWPYRLPSILAALIAVLATWRIGVTMFDARAGWLGALLLAVCPLLIWESKQARADMVLLAATTVAMWMVWSMFRRRRENEAGHPHAGRARLLKQAVLWLAVAAGVMTKGPVTIMVLGLTILFIGVMTRRWRWIGGLRPVLGVMLVAAVLGAWVWQVAARVGWSEYARIVGDEVLGRSVSPKEGHWGPPGYHLVLLAVLLWPGSLLTATALGRALHRGVRGERGARGWMSGLRRWWKSRHSGRRDELFCLAWILPSWIVFELIGTKLPHYTMPLYPPIALLSARAVLAAAAGSLSRVERTRCKAGFVVWLLLGLAITVAGPAALWWVAARAEEQHLVWWALGASITSLAALLLSVRCLRHRRFIAVQLAGVAALAASWPVLIGIVLPRLEEVWVTRGVQRALAASDPSAQRPVAAIGYHEDSLIFMTHGRAQRIGAEELPAWFTAHPDGLVVAPLEDAPDGLRRLDSIAGYNYSKGRRVRLLVADRAP
ncbi:MAG: glycosyltransferase family 39 protein [Phycisphaerales bacterium]|nr:glycosyltransferase family 39 protein [Phycisphaerales bacterium]